MKAAIVFIATLALYACGNPQQQDTGNTRRAHSATLNLAELPVAVASPVYAVGPYVMLDASRSYDPLGKPLSYTWSVPNPPPGWNTTWGGLLDRTERGTIAFYTYQPGGNFRGSFDVVLTVSNGTQTSRPVTFTVTVCCATTESPINASAFYARLPSYSVDEAKGLYRSYAPANWDADFKFAAAFGFSYPQLDFLKGVAPGTSITNLRNSQGPNSYSTSNGGARINGYTLDIANAVQVPVDLARVSYPSDYSAANARTITLTDPFCDNAPSRSTFLAADAGQYPLPVIKNQPLPGGTLKLAIIKDIWDVMNPSIGESCQNDVVATWNTAFDRLAQLGVNAISITPWTFFFTSSNGNEWTLPVAGTVPQVSQMTDSDVRWIVSLAKARGFKVYWVNQVQVVSRPDGSLLDPSATTRSDVTRAVSTLTTYLTERGRFLQSAGVDGVILGAWYWVNFSSYLGTEGMASANVSMINALKTAFTGEILYAPGSVDDITPALNGVVDRYLYNTYVGFDETSIRDYSVDAVKNQYVNNIPTYRSASGGKPLIFDATIQSRAGYFTYSPGYYDPFCTPRDTNVCIQTTLTADFSLQAIFTEAVLEAGTASGSDFGGVAFAYFVHPNLLPPQSFYNQDATVRGKPAEYILYRWLTR